MTEYEYHMAQAAKHLKAGNLVRAEWHEEQAEEVIGKEERS